MIRLPQMYCSHKADPTQPSTVNYVGRDPLGRLFRDSEKAVEVIV